MANSWVNDDYVLPNKSVTNPTAEVVSKPFKITAGGAVQLRVDVKLANVTGTVDSLLLQDSPDGITYTTRKTQTISATTDGFYTVTVLAQRATDQSILPLAHLARVALTATTATADVEEVRVSQEN
jgi:hypothetical protein